MNLFQPLEHVSHGQYFIFHTEAIFLFGDEQATDVTELFCLRQERNAWRGCTLSIKWSIQEWLHPMDDRMLWHKKTLHAHRDGCRTSVNTWGQKRSSWGGVCHRTSRYILVQVESLPFFGEISPPLAVSGWTHSFRSSRRDECQGCQYNIFGVLWNTKHLLSIGRSSHQCFQFNSSKSAHFLHPGPVCLMRRSRPICWSSWAQSQGSDSDFSTHQCCNNASFVSVFLGKSC